jgi:hypothetical protein
MPKYRFDLPVNKSRAVVDDVITEAKTLGGISNTTPWLRLLSMEEFIYQVVIDKLPEPDAAFLILKHELRLVRIEV